ncbi:MAG: hypothetical protein JRJ43_02610 [Deltaproteobacteria bacterium]|nr:hypothetical protein [Deltaproteobacteria bacterium]MBW1718442.1 hypothetical protein [Deltaproteobacteria bacterium]MBW1939475.1 hypothetical protein [Deltaproteobacteria bacterium]MBW2080610.1 hypothetical protein [Deltaproteobacteria bacterium]MBW2349742.1 hypothetical protein [Deltaproteobacteria bacterium]
MNFESGSILTQFRRVYNSISVLLLSLFVLAGCASYGHRVSPVLIPGTQPEYVELKGVEMLAVAFLDKKIAEERFGFDVRGSGLLPVQLVFDNQGMQKVSINSEQTFLIDQIGQAWPILSAEEAYQRVKGHVELGETAKGTVKPAVLLGAAGALAGFAVGIISGQDIGESVGKGAVLGGTVGALAGGTAAHSTASEKIRTDLAQRTLSNWPVEPGELAYGFLFFPGHKEATSVQQLRLAITIGQELHILNLLLANPSVPEL